MKESIFKKWYFWAIVIVVLYIALHPVEGYCGTRSTHNDLKIKRPNIYFWFNRNCHKCGIFGCGASL